MEIDVKKNLISFVLLFIILLSAAITLFRNMDTSKVTHFNKESELYKNQDLYIYTSNNNFGIHESPALTQDDIITDDKTQIMYAKNQVAIFFKKGTTHEQALKFVIEELDGVVLGYSESIRLYTVKLTQDFRNLEELDNFAESLSNDYPELVFGAMVNEIYEGIIVDGISTQGGL